MINTEDIYRCKVESQLPQIGRKLLDTHKDKRVFAFFGEMGVGKTRFIKDLCKLLSSEDYVTSPTFSIINEYKQVNGNSIFHFDFYRVNHKEIFDLGYEEYFFSGNYCFIEWAEKIKHLLPDDAIIVKMENKNGEREISF